MFCIHDCSSPTPKWFFSRCTFLTCPAQINLKSSLHGRSVWDSNPMGPAPKRCGMLGCAGLCGVRPRESHWDVNWILQLHSPLSEVATISSLGFWVGYVLQHSGKYLRIVKETLGHFGFSLSGELLCEPMCVRLRCKVPSSWTLHCKCDKSSALRL